MGLSRSPQLGDLDDALLLQCFSYLLPLPDLFNVAASCRRFRDLALDRRSWLFVTRPSTPCGDSAPPRQPSASLAAVQDDNPHWYRSCFTTLEAAVAASRPGDTILLEPGAVPHIVAAPVVVTHPLHILGGGTEAEECVLEGVPGLDSIVDFRASGRLANLTLRATSGACVAHTRGRLTVQGCTLGCEARGLPHLVAPLLTRAVSWPRPPPTPAAFGNRVAAATPDSPANTSMLGKRKQPQADTFSRDASAAVLVAGGRMVEAPAAKRLREWRHAAEAAAGAGVLSVAETRIQAVGCAVELRGTGCLSAVRAIYNYDHALMWLEVDSADVALSRSKDRWHGTGRPSVVEPAWENAAAPAATDGHGSSTPAAGAWAQRSGPATPPPSWAAAPGFDAAAFQRRVQQAGVAARLLGSAQPLTAVPTAQHQPSAGRLNQKAEEWCMHHSTSLAPAGSAPAAAAGAAPPDGGPC